MEFDIAAINASNDHELKMAILEKKREHHESVRSMREAWDRFTVSVKADVLNRALDKITKGAMISDNMGVLFLPSTPKLLASEGIKAENLMRMTIGGVMSFGTGEVSLEVFSEVTGNENSNSVLLHLFNSMKDFLGKFQNLQELRLLTDFHSTERSGALILLLDYYVRVKRVLGPQGLLLLMANDKAHHENDLDRGFSGPGKRFVKLAKTSGARDHIELLDCLRKDKSYSVTIVKRLPDYLKSLQPILNQTEVRKNLALIPSIPLVQFSVDGIRSKLRWDDKWSAWRDVASKLSEPIKLWPENTPLPKLLTQDLHPLDARRRKNLINTLESENIDWQSNSFWVEVLSPKPFEKEESVFAWPSFPERGTSPSADSLPSNEIRVVKVMDSKRLRDESYKFRVLYADGKPPSWQPASNLIDRNTSSFRSVISAPLQTYLDFHRGVRGQGIHLSVPLKAQILRLTDPAVVRHFLDTGKWNEPNPSKNQLKGVS